MFESITQSLNNAFQKLSGRGKLTEKNIRDGLREVRTALLEADVNYQVARDFIKKVTEQAVGEKVIQSVQPGQQIVKIVHDELVALMGTGDATIPQAATPPTVILMAGLQGSGKTTTCGKLALTLKDKGHKPLLVGGDLKRPGAVEQLAQIAAELEVPSYSEPGGLPTLVCRNGVEEARRQACDYVILDTAGRLHVDEELMQEVASIAQLTDPDQVYLVCDAMTGQDAVKSAKEFNERLPIDAVILTKLDGDTRGGAALSVRAVTGKPIKFVGMGEKLDRLEAFHGDRMASRILGMGDVVSLVEKAQEAVEEDEAKQLEKRLKKGKFDFDDFLKQLKMINRMGSMKDILAMIPGIGGQIADADIDEKELVYTRAIIQSMTPWERAHPDDIKGRRRLRIANGCGMEVAKVNQLLKQFREMRGAIKKLKGLGAFTGGGSPKQVEKQSDVMEKMMSGKSVGKRRATKRKFTFRKRKKR